MLKRMIALMLIMVALQARAYESTDNNTFIDRHFMKDSVLVMASGAVYGSAIEAICSKFTLRTGRVGYCMAFAAESLAFINLLQAQQPTWALATCKNLNLLFVVIASGYIGYTQLWPETTSVVLALAFSYQWGRIYSDCATHYLWKPYLGNMKLAVIHYVAINGVSTGMLIGGPVLWHSQNLQGRLKPFVLTLASTGTALLSTVFYMILLEPEKPFSILGTVKATAIAGVGVGVGVIAMAINFIEVGSRGRAVVGAFAGAVAGAIAGAVAEAGVGAIAEAETDAISVAVAQAQTIATAEAVAGAGAGLMLIITTRGLLEKLSNGDQTHSIKHSLAQAALISVPLLITSWLVSVNEWVMNDVPAHETMQGIYYPVYALFSGEWIKKLYHLIWLTE